MATIGPIKVNPILKDCIANTYPEVWAEARKNMESIEARADKYLQSQGLFRGACASQISYGASCMYDGYLQGAKEQKAIDEDHLREVKKMAKEKAFQWICESITLYVTYNEEDGYIIDYDEMRKDFFKEMEE